MSANTVLNLLGEELLQNSSEKIPTERLFGPGKVIGLYFSAHWCPPCRSFTPELIKFYKNFKNNSIGDSFDIIFISTDEDQSSFDEYFGDMPWSALPFTEQERKTKLSRRYRIRSIPSLVLLDGATYQVLTTDARSHVVDDPEGKEFPWKSRPFSDILNSVNLINNKGENVIYQNLSSHYKGLYFSAHWCPPCKTFTPQLIQTYQKVKEEGKKFEVIFISSDRSQESFDQYFSTMPWLAIPYTEEKVKKELTGMFGVGGIPTLIILDENNEVMTKNGRGEINVDPFGVKFPWRPEALEELTDKHMGILNEDPCLILFLDCEGSDREFVKSVLQPIAQDYFNRRQEDNAEDILHFFYGADDEICDSIRDFAQLGEKVPLLAILDISEEKQFVCDTSEITIEVVNNFVESYFKGELQPKVIRI